MPRRFPHAAPATALAESRENRWAAVSVIVAPDPDSVLLIRRAERSGDPWSGHIGLPGGRAERGDADLAATAIRETIEEIGWPLSREALVGELDDVWPNTPLPQIIVVRPFVFTVTERPAASLSPEVAEAFWVPLTELRNPAVLRDTPLQVRGQRLVFPGLSSAPGDRLGTHGTDPHPAALADGLTRSILQHSARSWGLSWRVPTGRPRPLTLVRTKLRLWYPYK